MLQTVVEHCRAALPLIMLTDPTEWSQLPTSQLNHLANQSLFGCVAERYVFVHCRARVSRAVSCLLFVCDLSVVFVRSSVAAEQEVIHPCVVYMCECECIRVLH